MHYLCEMSRFPAGLLVSSGWPLVTSAIIEDMRQNTLVVRISKPLPEVFAFCITPPNSSRWIPGIVDEKTSEWPVRVGTVYRLQNENGQWTEVVVDALRENELVEFSKDAYHCRYTFQTLDEQTTQLTYHEWVDSGALEPFSQKVLEKLRQVLEA